MLFRHLGYDGVGRAIEKAVEAVIRDGIVTYDLARQLPGVTPVKCSEFGEQVARRIGKGGSRRDAETQRKTF
jgi:isocitrate dehydrogenase